MSNNTEFKWTPDLIAEFLRDYLEKNGTVAELMEQFKESKQPKELLFTTEDGVSVYKDYSGRISIVYNDFSYNYDWSVSDIIPQLNDYGNVKYFSTKECAKQYIIDNQTLFSLKEIRSIGNVGENNPYYKKLVALAESKLNKNE